jgi:hypothetical protein
LQGAEDCRNKKQGLHSFSPRMHNPIRTQQQTHNNQNTNTTNTNTNTTYTDGHHPIYLR